MASHGTRACCSLLLLLCCCCGAWAFDECRFAHGSSNNIPGNYAGADDISATLAAALANYVAQPGKPAPPAMFASVTRYDPAFGGPPFVTAYGASGLRNSNIGNIAANKVQRNDLVKVGSCTKSITSTAMALLVDKYPNTITWTKTLGQLLGSAFAGSYASVTLQQLMGHRAGLIRDFTFNTCVGTCILATDIRQQFAKALLATSPNNMIGNYNYSNAGYILAGHIIDKFAGSAYEMFVAQNIFSPLGLTTANFGTYGVDPGNLPEMDYSVAYGHMGTSYGYSTSPVYGAVPAWWNPPGTAYMSTAAHGMWAGFHLRGALGGETIGGMSRANLLMTHTNVAGAGGPYAMGWINYTSTNSWPGANAIWHNGVFNGWYAIQWVMPARKLAVTVEMNVLYLNSAGGLSWNDALLESVAQSLASVFTIPQCVAAQAPVVAQVNKPSNPACVVSSSPPTANSKCAACLGVATAYPWYSSQAGTYTWKQCAAKCLSTVNCQAWSFGPAQAPDNTPLPGDATCILITGSSSPGRKLTADDSNTTSQLRGRKLTALGGGDGGGTTCRTVYSCGASGSSPGWTSGTVAAAYGLGPFPGKGRTNQHEPFNVVNAGNIGGAGTCANSAWECQQQCVAARFAPYGPCASYTFSNSLKQCYLYLNTGAAVDVSPVPACDLYTGTASAC